MSASGVTGRGTTASCRVCFIVPATRFSTSSGRVAEVRQAGGDADVGHQLLEDVGERVRAVDLGVGLTGQELGGAQVARGITGVGPAEDLRRGGRDGLAVGNHRHLGVADRTIVLDGTRDGVGVGVRQVGAGVAETGSGRCGGQRHVVAGVEVTAVHHRAPQVPPDEFERLLAPDVADRVRTAERGTLGRVFRGGLGVERTLV